MRNWAYFFPLSVFIYSWEENDHLSSSVFFPIGCRSRKSFFICIKLKDSELCHVAGHTTFGHQRSLSLAVAPVAGSHQLSIDMNGIVSLCRWVSLVVWRGLKMEYQLIFLLHTILQLVSIRYDAALSHMPDSHRVCPVCLWMCAH